jgi:hypothetical protein
MPRGRRTRGQQRARSPGRSTDGDEPPPSPELTAQLAIILGERGPLPLGTLAPAARRRKSTVLAALRAGPFTRTGRTKASRWDVVPQAPIGLTPEWLEARFATDLNGQLECLPSGFGIEVLADFERQGLVVRVGDGSFLRTASAEHLLGAFWALA